MAKRLKRTPRIEPSGMPHEAYGEEATEDYLETIHGLIKEKGYARVADISAHLEVQPPTVTKMIQRLGEKGLLVYERYRGIRLTQEGGRLAESVEHRHKVISKFLEMLGVKGRTVYEDAEGIEHHVHPITIELIAKLVRFAEEKPGWFREFERHQAKGARAQP